MNKIFGELALMCFLVPVFVAAPVWAQTESRVTISGRVKDADTSEPLASVNIFLANTTVLEFEVAEKSKIFYATAKHPLQIENKTWAIMHKFFWKISDMSPKPKKSDFISRQNMRR